MEVKELVLKTLKESSEPLRPGDIAQKANLDKKEVDKAIKELKKRGLDNVSQKMLLRSKIIVRKK